MSSSQRPRDGAVASPHPGTDLLKIVLPAALGLGILCVGLLPNFGHPLGDKTEHVLAFAVFASVVRNSGSKLSKPLVCFVVLAGVAVLLEVLQGLLLRSRIASESDALASILGVGLGIFASYQTRMRQVLAWIAIIIIAFAANWMLNVGRYKIHNAVFAQQAEAHFSL
ncbi:hypothetical protein WNY37_00245 [Henriciella sp. AS95]|uniref:hypothetical protein n=1 Tax=Henriciella sp. AS95 TaxID=3135782 RepID=UPI003175C5E1